MNWLPVVYSNIKCSYYSIVKIVFIINLSYLIPYVIILVLKQNQEYQISLVIIVCYYTCPIRFFPYIFFIIVSYEYNYLIKGAIVVSLLFWVWQLMIVWIGRYNEVWPDLFDRWKKQGAVWQSQVTGVAKSFDVFWSPPLWEFIILINN